MYDERGCHNGDDERSDSISAIQDNPVGDAVSKANTDIA